MAESPLRSHVKGIIKTHIREGDYRLRGGLRSKFFVDCRSLAQDRIRRGSVLTYLGKAIIDTYGLPYGWVLGGVALGGSLWSMLLSSGGESSYPLAFPAMVIDTQKALIHWREIRRPEATLILDDVTTTGQSLGWAVDLAQEEGFGILGAFTLVDREEGAREAMAAKGISLKALFTLGELLS